MNKYVATLCLPLLVLVSHDALAGTILGKATLQGAKEAKDAVVYIGKIKDKTFEPPEHHAVMDQKGLTFVPHVLPILVGTTVDFKNSDDVLHNVFTPSKAGDRFNLGTWGKGQMRSFTVKKPGEVVILCNVHPEMEAYIVVVETPYFALTDEEGTFRISDLSPGDYVLSIWHEKRKGKPQRITVPERGEITVNFTLHR